jgi:hypothetical protein
MDGWEYRSILFPVKQTLFGANGFKTDEVDEQLNELGRDGWEVYAVSNVLGVQGITTALLYHLRRPRQSQRSAGFSSGR